MNKFIANPVTTFKKFLQPKTQQYHIKLYYLFISVFIFAFIYLVLPDENFSGVNLVKETIKTEIIKKKVKKNIDESFTEGFESLTQGYQFTSKSKLSPYDQAKVKQKLDEATDVVKDDVETDTITPDKIETSLSQKMFDRLYFSVQNATLLGYGDIFPTSNISKTVVILQSLLTITLILY